MNHRVDIVAKMIEEVNGIDLLDRHPRAAEVYAYVFESSDKQRYVWQQKHPSDFPLVINRTYHIQTVVGKKLFGGRGLAIQDVELLGEMTLDTKVVRLNYNLSLE